MVNKKNIAVITSTRAEYGLLRSVIKNIDHSEILNLSLIVTGTHLSEKFGNTVTEIEKDGFNITKKIDILKFENDNLSITKTIAYTIEQFGYYFNKNKFDACLVLGDRYEIFAISVAASMQDIPLIHISGGDVTLGAKDDYFRHSITKMAKLHFPSCEEYRNRVIQLGEEPKTVYNVGGLGDENIRKIKLLSLDQLSVKFNYNFTKPYALVTFHPETLANKDVEQQFNELLLALDNFKDINFIFTKANADAGGEKINKLIDTYVNNNPKNIAFVSMGVINYLSAMKYAKIVIGNSSSGVVETPTFKIPTVNIGNRQKGRIICDNIINCICDEKQITSAINNALSSEFIQKAKKTISPYNGGDTAKKIVDIIEEKLSKNEFKNIKGFYDIK